MKKKLCVLLAGILIAAVSAGCSGNNDSSSASSGSSAVSSGSEASANADVSGDAAASEKTADSSENGNTSADSKTESNTEVSDAVEEGNTEDPDENTEDCEEDSEESVIDPEQGDNSLIADDPFVDLTYAAFSLDGANIGADVKLPAYYIIKSKSELSDFIQKYGNTYSLNKSSASGSQTDFVTKSSEYGDDFFVAQDIILVVAASDANDDPDLGDIVYKGDNNVNIGLWGNEPKANSNKKYVCYAVSYAKGSLDNQTITISYDGILEEGEEA